MKKMLMMLLSLGLLGGLATADNYNNNNSTLPSSDQVKQTVSDAASKTKETASDALITSTVKSKFLATKGLSSTDIEVTTKKGKVYLKGTVETQAEKELAGNVAENTDGVHKVDNRLKVVSE